MCQAKPYARRLCPTYFLQCRRPTNLKDIFFFYLNIFIRGRCRLVLGLRCRKKWCRMREMLVDYNHIIQVRRCRVVTCDLRKREMAMLRREV